MKKTVDLKKNANFKRRLMEYSNDLEVDVVYHLWAAILKNSQYSTQIYNLAYVQTVGQTIRQTVVQTIGQTEQILGQTHLNVYKHPIKFIISFHFFQLQMNTRFKKEIIEKKPSI